PTESTARCGTRTHRQQVNFVLRNWLSIGEKFNKISWRSDRAGRMRLLRLSRHVAGKQGSASSVLFDVPAEWVIAQGRLYLCALSLVAVYFDPPQPAELASASRMLLIGYFVY